MQHYTDTFDLKIKIDGQLKDITVISSETGIFNVYWLTVYLGCIKPVEDLLLGVTWITSSDILQDVAQEIGWHIESCYF